MSKHYVQQSVLSDIQYMSTEELEERYDIEILDDGTVWDKFAHKMFDDLRAWAEYAAAQEEDDNYATVSRIASNRQRYSYDD